MRWPSLPGVLAVTGLGLVLACVSTREQWAVSRFVGLTFPSLYTAVVDLLEAEGYPVRLGSVAQGTIQSEWIYGDSQREVRGPSRRRVFVEIVPAPEQGYVVRVRVAEEVVRRGGLMATRIRESEDWEDYNDNFEDAEYLAAKIRALLVDHLPERPAGDPEDAT